MHSIYILLSLLFFSLNESPLADFQWKYRIILLSGPQSDIDQQLKKYKKTRTGLLERDLVIIYPTKNVLHFFPKKNYPNVKVDDLIKYYNLDNKKFKSLLIGKDGMIKEKDTIIIPATKYFQAIDAMPMRISELRNKGGQ